MGRGGDAHGVGDLLVVGRAGFHGLGHAVPFAGVDEGDEIPLQILWRAVALGAGQGPGIGRGARLGTVDIVQEVGSPGLEHRQQGLEPLPVQLDGEMAVGQTDGTVRVGDGGAGQITSRAEWLRAVAAWSSSTVKRGETPASSGKRRSSFSQKAWMVWIFSPPGVSSARANSLRARERA